MLSLRLKASLLACVLCFCPALGAESSGGCPPPKTSAVKLSLNSQRNRTGHWVTQVDFENADNQGLLDLKETGRISFDLQHIQTGASCHGNPSMVIRARITAPPPHPGPDYELFPGMGYYKMHTDVAMFAGARETCAEEGTHLAIINSEQEADIMTELLGRYTKFDNASSNEYAYIGFHYLVDVGQFVTIFGDPLTKVGYLKWHGSEPTRPGNSRENCGLVHRDGKLADVVCHWISPFICEQEL